MNEKLVEALDHISDDHLTEALRLKRKKHYFLRAVAAVLALVVLFSLPNLPPPVNAYALAVPAEYDGDPYPNSEDYESRDAYRAALDEWKQHRDDRDLKTWTLNQNLLPFYKSTNRIFLDTEENRVWSPVNAGLALAMLAETSSGETQAQLLELLGADSMDTLREQVKALWQCISLDSQDEIRTLAASIWVDEGIDVRQELLDTLSEDYYASVYRTDLTSDSAAQAMGTWIKNNTGGILGDGVAPKISEQTVMTLLSTVWLQGVWMDEFSAAKNTTGIFHASGGDVECTYMNKNMTTMTYSWGEDYSAVAIPTKWEATTAWLILPDEGKTISDVLKNGDYLNTVAVESGTEDGRRGEYQVNLSLPKFDIRSDLGLREGLEQLGLTDVFREDCTDLSDSFMTEDPIFLDGIRQVTRVSIDETGVTGGSYTELIVSMGIPPDQIIDFRLDRPFLFVLTESTNGTLLFAGVVNEP